MKQVIILSIQDFEAELQATLQAIHIPVFSKVDIKGFKSGAGTIDPSNWFAHGTEPDFSVMYFAFVGDQVAHNILQSISDWNMGHDTTSPMHAYVLPVEKSI